MIIQNRDHEYVVIQKLDSDSMDQYVCRRVEGGKSVPCRIGALSQDHAKTLVPYLEERKNSSDFTGLLEYFTGDGNIYVVTKAGEGLSLEEKIAGERCGLTERVEIGHGLLEALLLSGADDFFCCGALSADRIMVSPALEVSFQYDLEGILEWEKTGFFDTSQRLAAALSYLFQEERKKKAFPEMDEMIAKLRQGDFKNLTDVYGWFEPVYEAWKGKKEEELKPESLGFRIWERLKRIFGFLPALIKIGLLALACLYLGLSVYEKVREPDFVQNYKKIGTLTIGGSKEDATEGGGSLNRREE